MYTSHEGGESGIVSAEPDEEEELVSHLHLEGAVFTSIVACMISSTFSFFIEVHLLHSH